MPLIFGAEGRRSNAFASRGEFPPHSAIEAKRRTDGLPLWIDDTPALTVSGLLTRARRLKRRHGLDLVVIDYLQLLRPARKEAYAAVHAELIKALGGDRLPTLPLHVIARNA
jgi:replicative DNA helicase